MRNSCRNLVGKREEKLRLEGIRCIRKNKMKIFFKEISVED